MATLSPSLSLPLSLPLPLPRSLSLVLFALLCFALLSLSLPRLKGTLPREQPVWLEVCTVLRAKSGSGTPRAERTSCNS